MKHSMIMMRVYSLDPDTQGYRILVDRLWPRGMKKDRLRLDLWAKEVTPSTPLRTWFGHKAERFEEFRNRYMSELDASDEAAEFARNCSHIIRDQDILLLYAAKDTEHNHVMVLKEWLLQQPSFESIEQAA
ncbi:MULTISPECIES: DUF488 domain-containing protein [Bifidobacterium]|jgi:uncharacterized protein YeaO (DUF488 family)|uniref:DUF488 family protein n=2 Tax=Bifidobacterium TaxID=1678 RepID=A0AB39U6Z5_9BIFI|nr:DUF488 family protein [Bifidobacterium crudilactis]MDN5973513.1 DUF488 family protein [Bifidobacterium crudilactis]MDN6001775.1 DUF488 family protein [Bifidobacterium crudilactis]MDN6210191.1 DUF488 family protein [Bifidobacterium crudilactis]MDN6271371.1 DUF488 family protein [Bifidobacterium crudilactis]MDN6425384.1 DUF488 family protein [Bifidobacterium crudilactis]